MAGKAFLDTNILVYAFAQDDPRSAAAERLLAEGGAISVQVLNEFCAVARRKLGMDWDEIDAAVTAIRVLCGEALPLTEATQGEARRIARRHGFAIYDASIVASACSAGCETLFSEDLQDGQKIGSLTIRNPFGG